MPIIKFRYYHSANDWGYNEFTEKEREVLEMKRVFLVEWGTESSMGTLDDPCQWKFDDLNDAIAFYDDIDLRYDWVREYNTSRHMSRDRIYAKTLSSNIDHGNWIDHEQVLQYDTYGIAEYRMEED